MKIIIDNPQELIMLLGMTNMIELSDYFEKNTDAKAACYERERNNEDPTILQFYFDPEEHGYDDNDVWDIDYDTPQVVFPCVYEYEGSDVLSVENLNDWAWGILEEILDDVDREFHNWLDVAKQFGKEPNVKTS